MERFASACGDDFRVHGGRESAQGELRDFNHKLQNQEDTAITSQLATGSHCVSLEDWTNSILQPTVRKHAQD